MSGEGAEHCTRGACAPYAKHTPDGRGPPCLPAGRGLRVPPNPKLFLRGLLTHAEAVAPTNDEQLLNGFGGDGFLRLGEPDGCLFLFCFAFRFPITRLGLAVPLSFDFALDRITADLATVFGGELVSLDLPGDCEGNLVTLEFAI